MDNDPLMTKAEFDVQIGDNTIKDAKKSAETLETFLIRVNDARKALDICSSTFKREWGEWVDNCDKMLADQRQWRMAIGSELSTSLAQFKDVRKFFLSDEHVVEAARLKEFVELCERLKALKDSGFLDKVTDTILRLEVKP